MSVRIRRLSVAEKIERVRARYEERAARHNATLIESWDLEPKPPIRDQVLDEFSAQTRRLAR